MSDLTYSQLRTFCFVLLPLRRSKEAKSGVNILCYRLDRRWIEMWSPSKSRRFPSSPKRPDTLWIATSPSVQRILWARKGKKRLGHEGDNLPSPSTTDANTCRHSASYGVYRQITYHPCLWLQSNIQLFRLNISHISRLSLAQCSSFLLIRPS
jgi:hypothetical protein